MKIAVCFCGDSADPAAFSGTPAGLTQALQAAGHSVLRINVALPSPLPRLAGRIRTLHPEQCRLHSRIAAAKLRALNHDAVVQIGTDFTITTSKPTVTYDDMTVAQHIRHHDDWFDRYPRRAQQAWHARQLRAFNNADRCCTLSRWAADSVINDYGQPVSKVRVIGLGGNHVVQVPTDRDWSTPRYLIVAKNWQRKNVPLVIETFTRLRTTYPSAALHVVGPYDGPAPAGVTLHGSLDLRNPRQRRIVEGLFRTATCYVMPSKHEASALVFVEAGAAGIPSIGTTVGGVSDLIGPGGTVVDPDDPSALLREMTRLADPYTASRLGASAAEHAKWYTWPATAERLIDVIREVQQSKNGIADISDGKATQRPNGCLRTKFSARTD